MKRDLRFLFFLVTLPILFGSTTLLYAEDTPLDVWHLWPAEEGAAATYRGEFAVSVRIVDRQGLFLLPGLDDIASSDASFAEYVTFTVLEKDEQGDMVLRVEARQVDPVSDRPHVAPMRWAVFRLDRATGTSELVESSYERTLLGSPDWFLWTVASEEQDSSPMLPGETRTIRIDTAELEGGQLALWGEEQNETKPNGTGLLHFIGWHESDEYDKAVALMRLTSNLQSEHLLEEFLKAFVSLDVDATLTLVPYDFPAQMQSTSLGTLRMEIDSERFPGTYGSLEAEIRISRGLRRTDEMPVSPPIEPIEQGEVRAGILPQESWVLDDGSQAMLFSFRGAEGEVVRATLESDDFDAYLLLLDEAWQILEEDDDSAGGTNAELRFRLPYTGSYLIVANTFFPDEVGRYKLTFESLGREIDPDAFREILYGGWQQVEQAAEQSDWEAVVLRLEETLERTRLQLPFRMSYVALVEERARGYGEYVPRLSRMFQPGETVHVYLEPANFHVRQESGRYEIHLTVDAVLLDRDGEVLQDLPDVVVFNRITSRPLKDVALSVPLWLADLANGPYTWRLTVRDMVSGQSTTVELPIIVSRTGRTDAYS